MRDQIIKGGSNAFSGMVSDLDSSHGLNLNKYIYAENAILSEGAHLGSLTNAHKIELLEPIDFEYDLLSHNSSDKFTVLVFRTSDSELFVYKYMEIEGEDRFIKIATINGDFSKCAHLSTELSVESDKVERLYIADGVNPIMSLSLYRKEDDPQWDKTYSSSELSMFRSSYDNINIEASITNGSLKTGRYYYVAKYISDAGALSKSSSVSPGIDLKRDDINGGYLNLSSDRTTSSPSGIKLKVSNLKGDESSIAIYRVSYTSDSESPSVNLIYISKIGSDSIEIIDADNNNVLSDSMPTDLVSQEAIIASVLSQKDNMLMAGDIKYGVPGIANDIDYDVRAFQFSNNNTLRYRNLDGTEHFSGEIQNADDLKDFLTGKDDDDFIFEDIYDSVWYRDVKHRYKMIRSSALQQGGMNKYNSIIYGGTGVNVSYEFCNAVLVGAEEGSRWTKGRSGLYRNTSDIRYQYNNNNLKWINILRDDLTIKYGDKVRDIKDIIIETQTTKGSGEKSISIVKDIQEFGIPHHKGKLDYSNGLIASTFAGYKRNEIYRFACKMTFKDGSETDPMWIADIRFPSNYIQRMNESPVPGDPGSSMIKKVYSFSSFEAPDDTISKVLNASVNNMAQDYDVAGVLGSGRDSTGVYRSELIVKPLGLSFSFNNLEDLISKGLHKIEILYSPMDYLSRSIVGQFAVNRIGKFSNSGIKADIEEGVDESSLIGYSNPHPTLSMKYLYGIGPMINYVGDKADSGRESYKETVASMSLGYNGYREAIASGSIHYSEGTTVSRQPAHRSTMTNTSSPYFADYENYMLVSPEATYVGGSYFDIIKGSRDLIFENIIYPKATFPNVPNCTSYSGSKSACKIPVVGGPTSQAYEDNVKAKHPGLHNAQWYYTGLSLATIGIPSLESLPSVMFSGAMIRKDDEYLSKTDSSYTYITLCGALDSSIEYGHNKTVDTGSSSRNVDLDANVFIEQLYRVNRANFAEVPFDAGYESNVKPPVFSGPGEAGFYDDAPGNTLPLSIKTYMSGVGYMNVITSNLFSDVNSGSIYWKSGYSSSPIGHYSSSSTGRTSEMGRFIDPNTNNPSYTDTYHLNAATFKYFRSSLDSYSRHYSLFESNNMTYTSAVSFVWQNGINFEDRTVTGSRSSNHVYPYNPARDTEGGVGGLREMANNVWDLRPINVSLNNFVDTPMEPIGPFSYDQSIGSPRLINYSKSLMHALTGVLRGSGFLNLSLFSMPNEGKFRPVSDFNGVDTGPFRNSLKMLNRGRVAGKHGAGILISTSKTSGEQSTIPMIGNIGVFRRQTRLYADMLNPSGAPLEKSQLRKKIHRLDQAVSTHNSTFLVDIRKASGLRNFVSSKDKKSSRYIHAAHTPMIVDEHTSSNMSAYVFGGDTYVTMFDYTNVYPTRVVPGESYNDDTPISDQKEAWNTQMYIDQQVKLNSLIPIESYINTHLDAGHSNHKELNPWDSSEPGMLPVNSGYSTPLIERPRRELNEYIYDQSYSSKRTFDAEERTYSYDDRFNDKIYRSRIIASQPKTYGETIDSFAVFKSSDYIDLNPSSGPITSLQTPLSRLYAFQPDSVYYLSVNDRSLITDDSGAQLILGVGGVLPYAHRLSSNYGLSSDTKNMIRTINDRVYFYDNKLKAIGFLSDGISSLSDPGAIKLVMNEVDADNSSSVFPLYDNERVVFSFKSIDTSKLDSSNMGSGGKNLMYVIEPRVFESIYTENVKYGFNYKKGNLVIDNRGIGAIGTQGLDLLLSYISNHDFISTKVFDLASINLSSTHSHSLPKESFEIKAVYENSRQKTLEKDISARSVNSEGDISFSIPRSYDLDTGKEKARMRDKYLKSTYKFCTDGKVISIPTIRIAYRHSVI